MYKELQSKLKAMELHRTLISTGEKSYFFFLLMPFAQGKGDTEYSRNAHEMSKERRIFLGVPALVDSRIHV